MKHKKLVVLVMTLVALGFGSHIMFAGEKKNPGNQKILSKAAQRLKAIEEMADVPIPERQRILKAIGDGLSYSQTSQAAQLKSYVKDIQTCVNWLTSCEFGDEQIQDVLCQRMVLDCLPLADKMSLDFEFGLVNQIRLGSGKNLDASGKKVSGKEWQVLREQLVEYRLHLWRRINKIIDPSWNPKDVPFLNLMPGGVGYPAGVAPEAIKEPEIRKKYEAALEANRKKSKKYSEQRAARDLRDNCLPNLKKAIGDDYEKGPTTADDLDVLKAYLRIYVSDKKLRSELFQIAQAAAKKAAAKKAAKKEPAKKTKKK
ncbi:MAG: hypothetical protein K8S55_14200 [Phycisphaerae bacterium]|nr:hypothetical protein [Phycisphaerae bacterium]